MELSSCLRGSDSYDYSDYTTWMLMVCTSRGISMFFRYELQYCGNEWRGQLPFPVVWSSLGPVPFVYVFPELLIQAWSDVAWVFHSHMLSSKLQSTWLPSVVEIYITETYVENKVRSSKNDICIAEALKYVAIYCIATAFNKFKSSRIMRKFVNEGIIWSETVTSKQRKILKLLKRILIFRSAIFRKTFN